ncbi:MAG: hypothetical protein H0T66_18730 [Geodermatophilaceae bacterium]|nr:hypothetical protein [Geodermatophilaceae bacterium]
MRVYVPATFPVLRTLLEAGSLGRPPVRAFAVTPAVREWYAEGDTDELEYAVLREAAAASLRLLDTDPAAERRRVVIAADVPDSEVAGRPELDRAVVSLSEPVPLSSVAAVHADTADAEDAVRAAAALVLEADLGSDDAQFVVDGADGYELAWYATQEIGALIELL